MIITVLRSRIRPEALDAYNACTEEMRILARAQPGFLAVRPTTLVTEKRSLSTSGNPGPCKKTRFRCHPLLLSMLQQWFACARLAVPYLTSPSAPFP
jgi:hypothetical protein